MIDVTESEAQRLLGSVSYCDGCTVWADGDVRGEKIIFAGLIDDTGSRNGLTLKLRYLVGPRSKGKSYLFSVYSLISYRMERVYQLAISQSPKRSKDVHDLPHEHFGQIRTLGTDEWAKWSYAQILEYFSTRTNILFRPTPPDPGQSLRRKK
jgi:hypothetical protein